VTLLRSRTVAIAVVWLAITSAIYVGRNATGRLGMFIYEGGPLFFIGPGALFEAICCSGGSDWSVRDDIIVIGVSTLIWTVVTIVIIKAYTFARRLLRRMRAV
jgi:hypothetical protein